MSDSKERNRNMKVIDLSTDQSIKFLDGLAIGWENYANTLNFKSVRKHYLACWEVFAKKEPSDQELTHIIHACDRMITLLKGQSELLSSIPEQDRLVYDRNLSKWLGLYNDLLTQSEKQKEYCFKPQEDYERIPKNWPKTWSSLHDLLIEEKVNNDRYGFITRLYDKYMDNTEPKSFACLALTIKKLGLVQGSNDQVFSSLQKIFSKERTGSRQNYAKHRDNHVETDLNTHIERVKICIHSNI